MARIRTVKPEFWDSPGIETLDPRWRLLYVAMWNWADDSGSGKAEARELMGFAFPRDEQMTLGEFRRGLGEVRRVFGVKFYRVEGRSFYNIPTWDKHQKIDKRSASRWPLSSEGVEFNPETNQQVKTTVAELPRVPAETPPSVRCDPGAGTGEQGNRGTGEQGKLKACATATPQHVGEPDLFDEFWKHYPRKAVKKTARQSWDRAIKREQPSVIVDAATRLAADPNLPTDETKIPHPSTWLNQDRWNEAPYPASSDGRKRTADDKARDWIRIGAELDAALPLEVES